MYRICEPWVAPLTAGMLAEVTYLFFAPLHGLSDRPVSFCAYYNYLADAFLNGQVHLRVVPMSTLDLTYVGGRYYLYWPPMPAILLMPFVAIWGINTSDILFTVAVGSLNVALVARLLRITVARRTLRLSGRERGLLVLCFAVGSVHLLLAPLGRVWFTGQIVGLFFVLTSYLVAFRNANRTGTWALFGLALAGTFATRYHMVVCGLWPACELWLRTSPQRGSGAYVLRLRRLP